MKLVRSTLVSSIVLAWSGSVLAQPAPMPAPASPPPGAEQTAPAAPEAAPDAAPASASPTPATPALPPTVAAPPPPAADLPAPAPPPAPKSLVVGSAGGNWKPGLLLQFWGYASHQVEHVPGKTAPAADTDTLTFRLRRAELHVKGDLIPKQVQFGVMIDPARALEFSNKKVLVADGGAGSVTVSQPNGAATILQDFAITFPTDYADVAVGQFKIPISLEGYNSSSKILFPERAAVARTYGDKRDIGVKATKKLGDNFFYYLGLFNGAGQNSLDTDTEKDGALRLEGTLEGLSVGVAGYTTIGRRKKSSKDRAEVDVKYDAHHVYVIGEYIHAWDSTGGGKAVEGNGTYVEGAYTFFEQLQPMVRVGELDPNMDRKGDHYWQYDFGVNWLLRGYEAKLGASLSIYSPTNPTPPSNPKRTEGIVAVQAAF